MPRSRRLNITTNRVLADLCLNQAKSPNKTDFWLDLPLNPAKSPQKTDFWLDYRANLAKSRFFHG